ncbi:MAG: hypothetical protein JST66_06520 [Bacteroidetes bacterium]|nr:hypothetical protein [Bacteroidota bacterium]
MAGRLPHLLLLAFAGSAAVDLHAQAATHKGLFEVDWGWNRSAYTRCDIRFTGSDHDFTLRDVKATDRPTAVSVDPYLNPLRITIPQTNFTLRYFLSDRYSIALRFDHMKYVLVQDQRVHMDGRITDAQSDYAGTYVDAPVTLAEPFLTYEHSDGLNYIHGEASRHDRVATLFRSHAALELAEGLGLGILLPRTACRFLGKPLSDDYHLSGYGLSGRVAAVLVLFDRFLLQAEAKGGYIGLPDVRTSADHRDRAEQRFWFAQGNVQIGARFRLSKAPAAQP